MHTQQRSVHAHHQQEAVAYAYAELQSFSRTLWYSIYCTITFAKQNDIVLVGDNTEILVLLCAYSDTDPNRIYVVIFCILHITFAKQNDIVLVVDNTELLVLLCAWSDTDPNRICVHTEPKSNIKGPRCYWDRLQVQQALGKYINKHMFICTCYIFLWYPHLKSLAAITKLKSCQFFLK